MSFRSVTAMRNVMFGKGLLPAIRPVIRPHYVRVESTFTKPKTISRFYTTGKNQSSKISSMAPSPGITQAAKAKAEPKQSKFTELTKKYGTVGIIVYLGVGCVDLGITLGIIQLVGLDKVRSLERGVLEVVYNTGERFGITKKPTIDAVVTGEVAAAGEDYTPSFASVFILAYGIHKTLLLPVRLGITAAITPAIVRKLHQMGWARYFPRILGASVPKKP